MKNKKTAAVLVLSFVLVLLVLVKISGKGEEISDKENIISIMETEKVSVTSPVVSTSSVTSDTTVISSQTDITLPPDTTVPLPVSSESVSSVSVTQQETAQTQLPESSEPAEDPVEGPEPDPEPYQEPEPEPDPEPEQPEMPQEHVCPSVSDFQREVVRIVNQKRSEAGVGPLSLSEDLCCCAQTRADEITYDFSHFRPDGSECFSVLGQHGIYPHSSAENIAAGSQDPASVVEQWMNSTSHRSNMLNPVYTSIGCGYCRLDQDDYVHYWTQIFTD